MKLVLTAGALATLCTAALAGDLKNPTGRPTNYGPMTMHVVASSRGLDLSSGAGAAAFLDRLSVAASRACEERTSPVLMLARSDGFTDCHAKAMALAMQQVRAPAVRRLYASRQVSETARLSRR